MTLEALGASELESASAAPVACYTSTEEMTEDRLELIAPDLSLRLRGVDDGMRRAAALAAARLALEVTGTTNPLLHEALRRAALGQFDAALREQVQALTDALDTEQWDVQEAMNRGEVGEAGYIKAFTRARAANAVAFTLDFDSLTAATESIYEAAAAVDDLDRLRFVVEGAIDS